MMVNVRRSVSFLAVFVLFFGLFLYNAHAYAEIVVYKSAITWHDDGTRVTTNLIESGKGVKTGGKVTSITASWKFEGQVRLEVSTNGGGNYASVINGVPLDLEGQGSGVRGQEIKWRARLESDSKLNEVKITYTDSLGTRGSFGEPELSGFKYRKPIHIENSAQKDLFNYQINIKVGAGLAPARDKAENYDVHCGGKVRDDFSDIRFTAADGMTLLSYYKEKQVDSGSAGVASFWVKIPQLPKYRGKIYLYYGNSRAQDQSRAEEVFDFFDGFSEGKLDLDKWEVSTDSNGGYSIVNSELKLDFAKVLSKDFQIKDAVIEYQAKAGSGCENLAIIRSEKDGGGSAQVAFSSGDENAQHCIAVGEKVKANEPRAIDLNAAYNYRVIAQGVNLSFQRFKDNPDKLDYNEDDLEASVSFQDVGGLTQGYVGLEAGQASTSFYNWIRIRKQVDLEPKIEVEKVVVEEKINLAKFENTEVNKKGNLVLKDGAVTGSYVSGGIATRFPTRVIVPRWEEISSRESSLAIGVSADGGQTYKEDCEQGGFYYASLKDFDMGTNLMFKTVMSREDKAASSPQLEQISLDVRKGKILLITPNGGEQWIPGTEEDIKWSASNYERDYKMNLEYSLDSGQSYEILAENVPNSGEFLWRIPGDISLTDEAKIRISDANCKDRCEDIVDQSDKVFRLVKVIEEEVEENTRSWDDLETEAGTIIDETTEVVIEDEITIVTEGNIKFKKLVIGDGIGENKTRLVLNHNIDSVSGNIVIRKGGELVQTNKETQEIAGDLIIEEGGILTHKANSDQELYEINITAQNIVLEPGGLITAQGKGYAGGKVREGGKGVSGGRYADGVKFACGGSHAGLGGGIEKHKLGRAADLKYGQRRVPQESGTGGAGSWEVSGGAGGGVIHLCAREEFVVSGRITANGQDGGVSQEGEFDGAGGAGGSVYLRGGVFSGMKMEITACGGSGHLTGGAGGGGRVHVKGDGDLNGKVTASGGEGLYKGKSGSLVLEED
jgi:hypothetical protein